MTDQLADLLHRCADDLPVHVRSLGGLKQSADEAQRRRRRIAVAASVVAVTLVVGAGAALARPHANAGPPTPAVTDTPPDVPTDRGLLRPDQLPTDSTFTDWTGAQPASAADIPVCVSQLGTPVDASYQRFTTDQLDTVAYQAVLNLGSAEAATVAADDANRPIPAGPALITRLLACAPLDGDGWNSVGGNRATSVVPWVGPSHRVMLLARAHAGPYLSLLWLSAPGTQTLTHDEVKAFNDVMASAIYESTASPLRNVPVGTLAQAMLRADDVPFGAAGHRNVQDALVSPDSFTPLEVCDQKGTTGHPAMRNVQFVNNNYDTAAGQRVYVAGNANDAHGLLGELRADIRRCATADQWGGRVDTWTDLDLSGIGDEAAGWSYRLDFVSGPQRGQHDSVYVALARVGSVVTEIVRREPTGDTDPGPQATVAFARTGVQRLVEQLPAAVTSRGD